MAEILSPQTCGACNECRRGLIQQRMWNKADRARRTEWMNAGLAPSQARGLCRACYLRSYDRGEIPARTPKSTPGKVPCIRCGIANTTGVCVDCAEYVEEWAS